MLFKNIRKVLDDFENVIEKDKNGEKLTKEEKATIMQSNFRLADALMSDWYNVEKVATMILIQKEMLGKIEVKFDNDIK